jgi:hypothetical protein
MVFKGTYGSLKIPPLILFVLKEGGAGLESALLILKNLGFPALTIEKL